MIGRTSAATARGKAKLGGWIQDLEAGRSLCLKALGHCQRKLQAQSSWQRAQPFRRTGVQLIPLDIVEKLVRLDLLACRPRFGGCEKPEDARRSDGHCSLMSGSHLTTDALIKDSADLETDEVGGNRKLSW